MAGNIPFYLNIIVDHCVMYLLSVVSSYLFAYIFIYVFNYVIIYVLYFLCIYICIFLFANSFTFYLRIVWYFRYLTYNI